MAQVAAVYKGDPTTVAAALDALTAANEILIVEKTFSAGEYIVVYNNSAGVGQNVAVYKGDPSTVAADLNGTAINIVCPTFSAGEYIVVED